MGARIGVMHYTGMAAMRMNAMMRYDPVLFAVSVIVAVVLATAALYTKFLASGRSGIRLVAERGRAADARGRVEAWIAERLARYGRLRLQAGEPNELRAALQKSLQSR